MTLRWILGAMHDVFSVEYSVLFVSYDAQLVNYDAPCTKSLNKFERSLSGPKSLRRDVFRFVIIYIKNSYKSLERPER